MCGFLCNKHLAKHKMCRILRRYKAKPFIKSSITKLVTLNIGDTQPLAFALPATFKA